MAKKNRAVVADTRLLTYEQIGVMLSVSTSQVFSLRERGRIPLKPIRLGGSVRFDRREVERWIESGCPVVWRGGK